MIRVWTDKKYKLERSENFEEFLKAIGLNFFIRKMISALSVTMELVVLEDGEFMLKQQTAFKNINLKFKPGVEFIDEKPNGVNVLTVMTFESENVLMQKGLNPRIEIRREFCEDEMEMVSFILSLKTKWFKIIKKTPTCCVIIT